MPVEWTLTCEVTCSLSRSPTRGSKNTVSTRKQESPCQQEAARRCRSFLWNVLKHKKNFLSGVLFCSPSEAPRGLQRRRWRRWSLHKSLMTPEGETGVEASGLLENKGEVDTQTLSANSTRQILSAGVRSSLFRDKSSSRLKSHNGKF